MIIEAENKEDHIWYILKGFAATLDLLLFTGLSKQKVDSTSLEVQWLRLCASDAGGVGLIPGQGTKILQAAQCSHKLKIKKQTKQKAVEATVPQCYEIDIRRERDRSLRDAFYEVLKSHNLHHKLKPFIKAE